MVDGITETTDGIAPRERWTFWKDTAMAAVDGARVDDGAGFDARRTVTDLALGSLVDTRSSPLSARRPERKIASDGCDDVCVMLLLEGRGQVDHRDAGTAPLPSGDVKLFDLARPYSVEVPTQYRELRLYVPRATFRAKVGRPDRVAGLQAPARAPLSRMFARHLGGFVGELPGMSRREADVGLDGVLHLLSGLVASCSDARRADDGCLSGEAVLAMADRHIQSMLGVPGLDAAMLGRVLGTSRTRLYAAFAARGGVAAAIRDARLDRASVRLLSAPDAHRSIEDVARACGFGDYATFARAFRRRFGDFPRAWRASRASASPA